MSISIHVIIWAAAKGTMYMNSPERKSDTKRCEVG